MIALSASQAVFLVLLLIYGGTIYLNTRIMRTMTKAVSRKQILALFHEEMLNIMKDYPTSPSSFGHDWEQELDLPEIYKHNLTSEEKKKMGLNPGRYVYKTPYLFHKNFTPGYVLGKGRQSKASIVIGIPSVRRPDGYSYLHDTLRSVVYNLYPSEEDDVAIVVFLADDMDIYASYVQSEARKIYKNFTREVENGLIQVISSPHHIYPSFYELPKTLNERIRRIEWRSKEVFDAAFLMFYCRHQGQYYLMLEDDLLAARGYLSAIQDFSKTHEDTPYLYLSFCAFNSIGKLFRSSDIPSWVTFFLNFYWLKPIDWLMDDFLFIKACYPEMSLERCESRKKLLKPQYQFGLFQHIGEYSSLRGKFVYVMDRTFSTLPVSNSSHRNPKAKVTTAFKTFDDSTAESWYRDSGAMNQHFFIMPAVVGDHITIEFDTMQTISKILVKSGHVQFGDMRADVEYRLHGNGSVLEYSSRGYGLQYPPYTQCAVFDHNGDAECRFGTSIQVATIRIRVIENNPEVAWLDLIYVQ